MIEIIKTLGIFSIGSFSIVGLFGYLFKSYFDNYLKQKLANHNHQLQLINENLRIKYDFIKFKKELAFSNIHEERAHLIKKLFSKIYSLKSIYNSLILPKAILSEKVVSDLNVEADNLKEIVGINRIFFDKSTCESLDTLIEFIYSTNQIIGETFEIKENLDQLIVQDSKKDFNDTYFGELMSDKQELVLKMNNILLILEKQFKELLGIEENINNVEDIS